MAHSTTSNPGKSSKTKPSSEQSGSLSAYTAIASVPLVLVFGNSMIIPILPEMKKALDISQFQTSLMISLFSVTAGLTIPIIGYLSDRFGRKAIMIPALIIYGLGGLLAGLGAVWESYGVMIAARSIQGLGAAGTSPIAMALVGDLYSGGQESKALGLTEAANGAGKVLSPIIGSLFALIAWYASFFAFPGFCILSLLAIIFWIKEPKRESSPPKLKPYLASIVDTFKAQGKWLLPAFFGGALALFVLFGVLFYLSDILEEAPYRIKGLTKGFVLAIPLTGMVITSYTTGSLIKKNGIVMRWLILIGFALMTAALGCSILFLKQIYLFITLLTISSIGTGLILPCLNTMITGSVELEQRGMITGLYSSLRFLGVAFGPPLFSWIMGKSHSAVFISVSALSLLALLLSFFLIKPDKEVR